MFWTILNVFNISMLIMFWVSSYQIDNEIKSGDRIQIGNAVYKCEKLQELDLK